MASNTNPYLRLLKKNENNLNAIRIRNGRIVRLYELLLHDIGDMPNTASESYLASKKKQAKQALTLIENHLTFVDEEKTQKSIDLLSTNQAIFLKPYAKLGI